MAASCVSSSAYDKAVGRALREIRKMLDDILSNKLGYTLTYHREDEAPVNKPTATEDTDTFFHYVSVSTDDSIAPLEEGTGKDKWMAIVERTRREITESMVNLCTDKRMDVDIYSYVEPRGMTGGLPVEGCEMKIKLVRLVPKTSTIAHIRHFIYTLVEDLTVACGGGLALYSGYMRKPSHTIHIGFYIDLSGDIDASMKRTMEFYGGELKMFVQELSGKYRDVGAYIQRRPDITDNMAMYTCTITA